MSGDDRVFAHVAFLVSAAGAALHEAPAYGAARMLVAAGRLVDTFDPADPFLQELKTSIERNVALIREDPAAVELWINDLMRRVGTEAATRAQTRR